MANDADAERLIVLLEARLTDFERNMLKASGVSKKNFDQIKKNSASATRQMEQDMARSTSRINQMLASVSTKIGGYGKAFAGGLVGGLVAGGIMGLADRIGDVAKSVAQIGDEAKRAGVSAKVFQEWKYVAEQARIPVDAMVDGLKELNLRADEFVITGKGPASEAFQRLGYSAEELKTKLQDPSALMLEIIGRLGKLDKAAQIRIADEIFGGSAGERFVELLDQGEAGIRSTIDEAHRLGVVLDDEVIRSAAELDRKFNAVANTVGTALKSAIVEAAQALTDFINAFKGFEFERSAKLGERMAALGKERLDVERQILELQDKQRQGEVFAGDGILGTSFGESTVLEALAESHRRMEAIAAEEQKISQVLESRTVKPPATTEWTPPESPPGGFGSSGSKGSRKRAPEAYERETASIRDRIAALVTETETLRQLDPTINDYGYAMAKAMTARELLSAAERDGKEITPQLKAEIDKLSDEYAQATVEAAKLAEAQGKMVDDMEFRKDIMRGVLSDFRSALADGKLEFEELGDIALNVLDKITDKLLNEVIDAIFQVKSAGSGGGGGFLGFLGSIFGGLFGGGGGGDPWAGLRLAGGGHVRGPGTETSDSIPAMLSNGEFVVNAKAARKNRGILEALNAGLALEHLALGGPVPGGEGGAEMVLEIGGRA